MEAENAYQMMGLEQGPDATEAEIKKVSVAPPLPPARRLAADASARVSAGLPHNGSGQASRQEPRQPQRGKRVCSAAKSLRTADGQGGTCGAGQPAQVRPCCLLLLLLACIPRPHPLPCLLIIPVPLPLVLRAKSMRAERQAGHDDKRRRMMADLERREQGWQAARTQEETARAKLHAEMERLRRQASQRAAQKAAEQRAAAAAVRSEPRGSADASAAAQAQAQQGGGAVGSAAPGELGEDVKERLNRTLKVSWSRKVRGQVDSCWPGSRVHIHQCCLKEGQAVALLQQAFCLAYSGQLLRRRPAAARPAQPCSMPAQHISQPRLPHSSLAPA